MSANNTKDEAAETEEVKAAEAKSENAAKKAPKKETKPESKPVQEKCGFCVYMGPTIRAAIQRGAIFATSRDKTVKGFKTLIEKHPLVGELIIPGDEVAKARIKLDTPGTYLSESYEKLNGQIN